MDATENTPDQTPNFVVNVQGYQRRPINHLRHFVATLLTCGLWAPIWFVRAVSR